MDFKSILFFEPVHELFMNCSKVFKFDGNIQMFPIFFELVHELFMNSSRIHEQFM
jgi:hypothetical protein